MVFISVTALHVSLFVTLVVVIGELVAVSVVYTTLRFFETRVLRTGGNVSLCRHQRRLKFIAVVLMLSFVALETIYSLSSEVQFKPIFEKQPCISLIPRLGNDNESTRNEKMADVIAFKCLTVDGTKFSQTVGSVSLISSNVTCSNTTLYSYNTSERVSRLPSNENKFCRPPSFQQLDGESPLDVSEQLPSICVFYDYMNDTLLLSDNIIFDEVEAELQFLPTKTYFNTTSAFLADVAERLLDEYESAAGTEEFILRRKIFTTTVRETCEFQIGATEGTDVPISVIAVFASIGFFLLLGIIWNIWVYCKRQLIDLSNPLLLTENYEGGRPSNKVSVEMNQEDGKLCVSDLRRLS